MSTEGIKTLLQEHESEFTWDYDFTVVGASAFTHFADSWGAGTFAKKAKYESLVNGYLYGVGCDSILAMLELFPEKSTPRGIILTDIDPSVVTCAKMVTHCFARESTPKDFLKAICGAHPKFFEGHYESVLREEKNPIFKEHMESHKERTRTTWNYSFTKAPTHNTPFWMEERGYAILHNLAKSRNIVVLHADLFDPVLLQHISELPLWKSSSNLIYMANACDHIYRHVIGGCSKKQFIKGLNEQIIAPLEILAPNKPFSNHFVDTTQAISYNLRLRKTIPYFSTTDF